MQLTQRINTLKVSLAQAINIAEQSTLHKLELAEVCGNFSGENVYSANLNLKDHIILFVFLKSIDFFPIHDSVPKAQKSQG